MIVISNQDGAEMNCPVSGISTMMGRRVTEILVEDGALVEMICEMTVAEMIGHGTCHQEFGDGKNEMDIVMREALGEGLVTEMGPRDAIWTETDWMTVDAWMTEELTIVDASMTVGWTIVEWMTVDEWKIVEWMTVEVVGGEMTVTVPRRVDGVIVTVKSVTVLLQVYGAAAMIVGVTSVTGLVGDGVMTVIGRALGEGVIEMNTSVPREMGGALVIVETGNAKIVTVETVTLTASEESVTETVVIAMTVTVTGLAGGASAQMIAEVIEMDGEEEMNRVVTSGDGNRHPPVQKESLGLLLVVVVSAHPRSSLIQMVGPQFSINE